MCSSNNFYNILILAGIIFAALVIIGIVPVCTIVQQRNLFSYVQGFGGEKVILIGSAIVLPVLHGSIPVNMNTLRLGFAILMIKRSLPVTVCVVDVGRFYVRVKPLAESIAMAARATLGQNHVSNRLKNLVEGKFVDSLRAVAAEMAMEELHEKRGLLYKKYNKWCPKTYIKMV